MGQLTMPSGIMRALVSMYSFVYSINLAPPFLNAAQPQA